MQEVLSQTTKMMDSMMGSWRQMVENPPWAPMSQQAIQYGWTTMISSMRTTYDTNLEVWNSLANQGEKAFLRVLKESPWYSSDLENDFREVSGAIKKARSAQAELIKDNLDKMEKLVKDGGALS